MNTSRVQSGALVPRQRTESVPWSQSGWYAHVETYLEETGWAEFTPTVVACIARALEVCADHGISIIVTPALVDEYIGEVTALYLEEEFEGTFRRGNA